METTYPVFEGGQTLTAHDLNRLKSFHHDRERLLGLLVGFGINAGLTGSITGSTLTIAPGLGIDQVGEPLLAGKPAEIALPPTPSADVFAFVDAAAGGFSVVLEGIDTVTPAPDCGDPDCAGHAEQHTRDAVLRVVAGRVTGPRFDFGLEPLLAQKPLPLGATPAAYNQLRDAIATRLTNSGAPLIATASITALRATTLAAGDLPGIKGYKAGFLDQVLFATLDLLRISRLLAMPTERTGAARPGLVLGLLHRVGTAWVWDCGFRHAWEPPTGLVRSLLGGSCQDPAKEYRDTIEALISTYAPPNPPPEPGGGGGTGPFTIEPGDIFYCPDGKCVMYEPPVVFPHDWDKKYRTPIDPLWDPPEWTVQLKETVTTIYQKQPLAFFGDGLIDQRVLLGRPAATVKPILTARMTGLAGTANVLIRTQAQAEAMPGFEVAGNLNLADTAVLVTDAGGKVISTGRIPAAHSVREIGTALPAAVAKADQAIVKATQHETAIGTLETTVAEFGGQIDAFATFTVTANQKFGTLDGQIAGLGRTQDTISPLITTLTHRVGEVEGVAKNLQGSVATLNAVAGTGGGRTVGERLGVDAGKSLVGFAGIVTEGLASLVTQQNEKTLGRYVNDAKNAAAALDQVTAIGNDVEIGTAAVALLSSMRTAIKSAGIAPEQARALDTQFRVVRGLLG